MIGPGDRLGLDHVRAEKVPEPIRARWDLHANGVRRRGVRRLLIVVVVGLLAGCGGSSRPAPERAGRGPIPTVACSVPRSLARAPPPQETGVYRAGPLLLVTGEDLAEIPRRQLRRPSGSEAIAVLTGDQPVVLGVDPDARTRFALQFAAPRPDRAATGIAAGRNTVHFPACGHTPYRFAGGVVFTGVGCALLHVTKTDGASLPLLIPIGNTLKGCLGRAAHIRLPQSALPFLGVACSQPNSIACDRVGVGVHLKAAATLVTVTVAGRLVTLSPPFDPRDDLWYGYLSDAGLSHGPLDVHRARGRLWFGIPEVSARVRVTAFFADGTAASREAVDVLHPGFG